MIIRVMYNIDAGVYGGPDNLNQWSWDVAINSPLTFRVHDAKVCDCLLALCCILQASQIPLPPDLWQQ